MARKGQAGPGRRIPTINHILPKARGGTDTLHGGARNWELMCIECNAFLALCGHCPGAAAAVEAVSSRAPGNRHTVAVLWGMPLRAMEADRAFAKTPGGVEWAMKQQRRRLAAREVAG